MTQAGTTELPDETVVLVLRELAQDLPMGDDVGSEDEARVALAELLRCAGVDEDVAESVLVSDADAVATGRRLLAVLEADPDTARMTRAALDDPPEDEQMSVELLVLAPIVLAAVLGWLQTKIDLKIVRKDGRTDVEFRMRKAAADQEVLQSVARTVAGMVGAPRSDDPSA